MTVGAEVGALRPLTDPTFRPPGVTTAGDGALSTRPPAVHVDDISYSAIDVVLPSHDQHGDQLARTQTAWTPLVFTTGGRCAIARPVRVGDDVASHQPAPADDGGPRMTAVPAAHERAARDDTHGSAWSAVDVPTEYLRGDTRSPGMVRTVAHTSPSAGRRRVPAPGDTTVI
jgi:hypothetical protein